MGECSSTRENIPLNCDSTAWGRGWGRVGVGLFKGPRDVFVACGSGEQTCLAVFVRISK